MTTVCLSELSRICRLGGLGWGQSRALRVSVGLQIHLLLSLKIQIHTIALLNKMQTPLKMGLRDVILKEQWTHSRGDGMKEKAWVPGTRKWQGQEEGTITGRAELPLPPKYADCSPHAPARPQCFVTRCLCRCHVPHERHCPAIFPANPARPHPSNVSTKSGTLAGSCGFSCRLDSCSSNSHFVAQFFSLQYSGEENALDASFPSLS